CGLVQTTPPLKEGEAAACARCGFTVLRRKPNSAARTGALALAALILYFPANFYPIVSTDYWGAHRETRIFDGIRGLAESGEWAIAALVFTTSIFSPALKIISLLLLSLTVKSARGKKLRTWTYKIILIVDPWNMLEVYLLAVVVGLVELGRVATVQPGAGV